MKRYGIPVLWNSQFIVLGPLPNQETPVAL
jgi:hypothetical protein